MHNPVETISVSVTLLGQMLIYLRSLGIDNEAYLRSFGMDPSVVLAPDARIPVETYLLIQEEAARRVNDPCFGLHMGEYAQAGSWSIIGYMMMNCRTLAEAFEKAGRYARIIGNLIDARARIGLNKVRLIYFSQPLAPEMSRHCFECAFSSTVRLMHALTGQRLYPLEVRLIYPDPASRSEYERIFNCPVRFGQKENSMTLNIGLGGVPILQPNLELLDHFENYARAVMAELGRDDEWTRRATRIILARLDDESLSIAKVARELDISVRTLQNRLKEEGMRFCELLQDTREMLAKKYLRENISVEDITYLLGFSEPSAFRKAFKKWSGATPREFRERTRCAKGGQSGMTI